MLPFRQGAGRWQQRRRQQPHDNSPMNGVVGGSVPAKLWRRFMTAALAQDRAANTPRPRRPEANAIGDLVGAVAGSEAGDAAGAVSGVVLDAQDGGVDAEAVADAAGLVDEAVSAPPEEAPPPQ